MQVTEQCYRCGWDCPAKILMRTGGYCEGCEWMRLPEAAARLGTTYTSMYRYIKRGIVAGARVGEKMIRVRRADVERLIVPL